VNSYNVVIVPDSKTYAQAGISSPTKGKERRRSARWKSSHARWREQVTVLAWPRAWP